MDPSQVLLQADVNTTDDDDDDDEMGRIPPKKSNDEDPEKGLGSLDKDTTPGAAAEKSPAAAAKLYPTAPAFEESDGSTASAHSTSV